MAEGKGAKKTPEAFRKKGGARFPRYSLREVLPWAKKLVAKTHLGPQDQDIIFASVVEAKHSTGQIKISALKQFQLLEGTSKAYRATDLARSITSAPEEERGGLLARAALSPDVFKSLYQTFHGDEVSISKLRQRASDLKVHPEEVERCINLYVDSLEAAGIVSTHGDQVRHKSDLGTEDVPAAADAEERDEVEDIPTGTSEIADSAESGMEEQELSYDQSLRPRAVFNVNVNLDSSLDTEKLEKQLRLLKRYGAI
jgi:hypothetical protein